MSELKHKPLFTFALFAYNQERFIAEAVQGALAQTYSPLEVILSDDCSSDHTFEIMQQMAAEYRGPHQVVVRRNERNLGLIGHINRVMELARGEWIVAAAGDDVSKSNRVEKIFHCYVKSNEKARCIFSRKWEIIDERGVFIKTGESSIKKCESFGFFSKTRTFVPGHSNAWHRSVFDIFGPLDENLISEDIVIPFRAAIIGDVIPIDESLVLRRHHLNHLGGIRVKTSIKNVFIWYKARRPIHVMNRIGIANNILRDVQTAKEMFPILEKELVCIERFYERYLEFNRMEYDMLGLNFLGKLKIAYKAICRGFSVRHVLFWFLYDYFAVINVYFPFISFLKRYSKLLSKEVLINDYSS